MISEDELVAEKLLVKYGPMYAQRTMRRKVGELNAARGMFRAAITNALRAARIDGRLAAGIAISAEARRIAEMYDQGSDGRNTFILLAEWIEAQKYAG